MEHKAYLHRSGRTARAGSEGDVVTICLPVQQKDLAALLRKAEITVTPEAVTKESESVKALIGEVAAYVKPAPKEHKPQGGGGTSMGKNAQRKRAMRENGNSGSGRPARVTREGQPARDRSGRPATRQGQTGSSNGQARAARPARQNQRASR
jgi:superfamily II DNA/RNA helicase